MSNNEIVHDRWHMGHSAARPPKRQERLVWITGMSFLVFVALIIVLYAVVRFAPYSEFEVFPVEYTDVMEIPILNTTQEDENGVPVVSDSIVRYKIASCNQGVDLEVTKWADSYGRFSDGSDLSIGEDERSGSLLLENRKFYVREPTCSNESVVTVDVSGLSAGLLYRIRVNYSYKPNPIADDLVVTETETFVYSPEGGER